MILFNFNKKQSFTSFMSVSKKGFVLFGTKPFFYLKFIL